jgi:hypothetical protein
MLPRYSPSPSPQCIVNSHILLLLLLLYYYYYNYFILLGYGWMIGGSSPGRVWEFFSSPQLPERFWIPPSLLCSTKVSLPGVKRPGREADNSPPSSAEVKECVELYVHSPNKPSWCGAQLKHTDNFTFTLLCYSMLRQQSDSFTQT